jgi:hypothetical protein
VAEAEPSAVTDPALRSLRHALHNNMAACHLAAGKWTACVEACDAALAIEPAAKSYYRRAVALVEARGLGPAARGKPPAHRCLLRLASPRTAAAISRPAHRCCA